MTLRRDHSSYAPRRARRTTDDGAVRIPAALPDALEQLAAEHRAIRALVTTLADSTEDDGRARREALHVLRVSLRVHARLEEAIFYPAFAAAARTADDEVAIYAAEIEHQIVLDALDRLDGTPVPTTEFRALAKVLRDLVSHHARESEQTLFPRARQLLPVSTLASMAAEMHSLREVFVGEPIAAPPRAPIIEAVRREA